MENKIFKDSRSSTEIKKKNEEPNESHQIKPVIPKPQSKPETNKVMVNHQLINKPSDKKVLIDSDKKCNNCNALNRSPAKYCNQCGTEFKQICSKCSIEAEGSDKSCYICGGDYI